MNVIKKLFIVHVITLLIISCSDKDRIIDDKKNTWEKISPKTTYSVIDPESTKFIRVSDLGVIAYALEKYKIKYKKYPISSSNGTGWDGLYSDYGVSRVDWIEGLVPEYLSALPRDPRMLNDASYQYLYRSNGAHYKLIAHFPDDCDEVYKVYPQLVHPERGCWAYGYWTPNAAHW